MTIFNPYRYAAAGGGISGEASLPLFWFDLDDDNVWDDQGWARLRGLSENQTITTDASGPNGQTVAVITGQNDKFGPDPFSTEIPYDGESPLMSFSLWYYRTGGDDISELWAWKQNDTDRIFDVTINTITDTLDVHFDDINDNSSNPIATNVGHTDNAWHHVCASWDGTTGRLYFDGEEVASDNLGRTGGTVNSNNRKWTLGGDALNTFKYTGKLAMAGFWDNAITANDVSYLYNNALGRQFSEFTFTSGVRAPLHYWNLDTSSWEDSVTANAWNAGLTENGTPTLAGGVGPGGQDVLSIDRGDWISDNQVWDGKTQIYDRDRISVSAWVYIDSYDTNGNMYVAWRNVSGDGVVALQSTLSGGKYVLRGSITRDTGSCVIDDTNFELSTGAWHHIACTFDNRVGKLYADNFLIATTSVADNGKFATGSMIFNIGNFVNDVASYNRQGDGYIAMVGIWDTALAAQEISHLYNAGAGLKYSELNLLPVGY